MLEVTSTMFVITHSTTNPVGCWGVKNFRATHTGFLLILP